MQVCIVLLYFSLLLILFVIQLMLLLLLNYCRIDMGKVLIGNHPQKLVAL